jgi:outer membrane protein
MAGLLAASLVIIAAAALLFPPALKAQRPEEVLAGTEAAARDEDGVGFRATIGAGIGYVPEFEGSDKNKLTPLPVFDLRYGDFFLSSARGLGYTIVRTEWLTIAPAVSYVFGRDESDSVLLAGMGDVKGGVAIGGLVGVHTGPVGLDMTVNLGVGSFNGSTVGLDAWYALPVGPSWSARLGLGTMFATSEYNQARFGVTDAQAARSGYNPYDASSGFKHLALSGTLSMDLTEMINLGFFGEYRVLTGPAEDSPLVRAGSENQLRTGLTLGFDLN